MYVLVEYDYVGNWDNKDTPNAVVTTVSYPDSTDELHNILEEIAIRRGIWPIDENNIRKLVDIVDVNLIEDIFWEDSFVAKKGVQE